MAGRHFLSDDQVQHLTELWEAHQRQSMGNQPLQPPPMPPMNEPWDYVCKTPAGGIAGLSGDTISSELCDVYREASSVVAGQKTLTAITAGSSPWQLRVYNLDTDDAPGDTFVKTGLTKGGTRIIYNPSGSSVAGMKGKQFHRTLANQTAGAINVDLNEEFPATTVYTHPQFTITSGQLFASETGYYFYGFNFRADIANNGSLSAVTHIRTGFSATGRTLYTHASVWLPALTNSTGTTDNIDISCSGVLYVSDATKAIQVFVHRHGDTSQALDYYWRIFLSEKMY